MHRISNSTKALLKKVATSLLPALLGVGAIYLILSNGFSRRTTESPKASLDVHVTPLSRDPQSAAADENERSGVTATPASQDTHEDPHLATLENKAPIAQTPAPAATPALTPAPDHKAFTNDSEFLAAQQPQNDRSKLEKQPGEAERRSLERKREKAERHRARLEAMYQKHRISSDAYKKGEEKYKSEIEEYRSAVNAGKAPKNDS
jgi:hypothetical protein